MNESWSGSGGCMHHSDRITACAQSGKRQSVIGYTFAITALIGGLFLNAASYAEAAELTRAIPGDKYQITPEERSACTADAFAYCSNTYPDEDRLMSCMRQNHDSLSQGCRIVFDAGVKRRHLN